MIAKTPEQKASKAEYMREYRRKRNTTPEGRARQTAYQRAHQRKHRYGLTPEQHAAMVEAQGGLCAICQRKRKLVVDHCHETGVVRGLLCGECNIGIGKLGDTPASLARAVKYLRDARKRQQLPLPEAELRSPGKDEEDA